MAHSGITDTPARPIPLETEESTTCPNRRSYLGVGLYAVPEAARLLRMPLATLRRWLLVAGPPAAAAPSHARPLIQRDDPELVACGLLTFPELIDLLLIRRLREAGVPLGMIRAVAAQAARKFQTSHPFATRPFYADRLPPPAGNDEAAWEPVIATFAAELDFADDRVSRYWPLGKERRVVLDPARAFGQPIDPASGVPTRVLAGSHAAGETTEAVAEWYRVELEAVRDALQFEQSLTPARLPRAA
jgi:uncharacterized protein (DUF433 family)